MSEEAPAAAEIEIKTDFEIPKMAEPKIDPNLDDFTRMRLEKDLKELKRMIETHFQVRKKDEEELQGLKVRKNNFCPNWTSLGPELWEFKGTQIVVNS